MSPYDLWKTREPDYIDEPEQVIPDNFLTAPRDQDEEGFCYLCGFESGGVLCYECVEEIEGYVYVSHSVGYMPFSRQVNELVGVH